MSPERWQRLKELFSEAVERRGTDREDYLESACAGDADLLASLRALIAGHEHAGEFPSLPPMAASPAAAAPLFQPGDLIAGRFRITAFLARGGMGEVYSATDTALNQDVALKSIHRGFRSDHALELIKQELHSARRVTHPNVCRIHDIAEHSEPRVTLLSMELLDGPTLSRRVREYGPFTRAGAQPIVEQIAHGLQAAHDAGVIHRDLKPGNILLTGGPGEWKPVITDFGLALSPQSRIAEAGFRAGTPGFMAPEQLEGRPATIASDIYAFGVVIAALVGAFPLAGRTPCSHGDPRTLPEPDWGKLGPWKSVVRRCLAGNPGDRFASASDVARALRATAHNRAKTVAAAAVVLAIAILLFWRTGPPGPAATGFVSRKIADERAQDMFWDVSNDGRWLAASDWTAGQLLLRDSNARVIRPLTKAGPSRTAALDAVFAPDGSAVAFTLRSEQGSELRTAGVASGAIRTVLRDQSVAEASPAAWSRDASHIALYARWKDGSSGLGLLSLTTGLVARVATSEAAKAAGRACFSPSGRELIFDAPQTAAGSLRDLFAVALENGVERRLISDPYDQYLIGLSPDATRLVFVSDLSGQYSIWSARLAPDLSVGKPELAFAASGRISPVALTRLGALYYRVDLDYRKVYTAQLDPKSLRTVAGPRELGLGMFPAWSARGELAYQSNPGVSGPHIVVTDPGEAASRSLALQLSYAARPQWRTTEKLVVFGTGQGKEGYFQIDARSGTAEFIMDGATAQTTFEGVWSRDGAIWFNRYGQNRRGLFRYDSRTGRRTQLFTPQAGQELGMENLALSPDGKTLAFQVRERPRLETGTLMLIPASGGVPQPVLTVRSPRMFGYGAFAWLPDSKALLVANTDRTSRESELWLVPVNGGPAERIAFPPMPVRNLRMSPDGKTIAFFAGEGERSELRVLENFLPAPSRTAQP